MNNSNNSKDKTALAVTLAGTAVYLYYLGKGNVVYRVVKEGGTWGSSQAVEGVQKCSEASDLAVTTANNVNHLFYLPANTSQYEFVHFVDSLRSGA